MGNFSSDERYLGSYTFESFTEGFQKFTTIWTGPDPFGEAWRWTVKHGKGEVDIAVTTDGTFHFVVFSFEGKDGSHIFVYNAGHGTMDSRQENGMSFTKSGEQDHVTFVFHQPKELTPLGTAELKWSILADFLNLPIGYPVVVSVKITPVLTPTTSSI